MKDSEILGGANNWGRHQVDNIKFDNFELSGHEATSLKQAHIDLIGPTRQVEVTKSPVPHPTPPPPPTPKPTPPPTPLPTPKPTPPPPPPPPTPTPTPSPVVSYDNRVDLPGCDSSSYRLSKYSISSGQPFKGVSTKASELHVMAGHQPSAGPANDFRK